MQTYKSRLSMLGLRREVRRLKCWTDGSGALMIAKACAGLPDYIMCHETISAAVDEISNLRETPALHIMINILPPGVVVPVHTDTLLPTANLGERPCLERWHLPIQTNEECLFWSDGEHYRMCEGVWHGPVPYWRNHTVKNLGKTDRIHIVVDLDSKVSQGEYA